MNTIFASLLLPTILSILVLLPLPLLGRGAWNRKPDGYYIKLGPTFLTAYQEHDLQGELRDIFNDPINFRNPSFGITNIGFYAELGLTDWLTGTLSTQYSVAVRQATLPNGVDTSQSASGLGDIWLGGRMRLLPDGGAIVGAITLGVKLPTGSPNQEIPLGTGVVDYEGAVAFGGPLALAGMQGYWQSSGGYRFRSRGADELTYQAEVGVSIAETLTLQGVVDGVRSFADFDGASGVGGAMVSTVSSDQSFARWNASFIYALAPDTDLNVGYGHTFAGRNALSAGAFGVGVAWKQ
ncbi:MAG: hypothetical protein IT211_10040 [Armatimonadetes bacterium]|nr:hypothetical protein [Armatimonadota bacterium]